MGWGGGGGAGEEICANDPSRVTKLAVIFLDGKTL